MGLGKFHPRYFRGVSNHEDNRLHSRIELYWNEKHEKTSYVHWRTITDNAVLLVDGIDMRTKNFFTYIS